METVDLTTFAKSIPAVLIGSFCIMGLAIFSALIGWGLEILRRREATIIILLGLLLSSFIVIIALNSTRINNTYTNITDQFKPEPTLMTTAIPAPTTTPTPKRLDSSR